MSSPNTSAPQPTETVIVFHNPRVQAWAENPESRHEGWFASNGPWMSHPIIASSKCCGVRLWWWSMLILLAVVIVMILLLTKNM